jgi:hypothetical protein
MLALFYNYIKNYSKNEIPDEKLWIDDKINEWKINLFSNNTYLSSIPHNKIIEKHEEFRKDFKKKFL